MKNASRTIALKKATISSLLKDFYTPQLKGLIAPDCFHKIANFTERFPENLSPFFGYEIQLGNNNNQADFLFCISSPVHFRNFVNSEAINGSVQNFDSETFTGLDNFSLFWSDEGRNSKNPINNIWFEFDYEEMEKKRPKACFFFGPKINLNHLEVLLLTEKVFSKIFNKQVKKETLKKLLEINRFLGKQSFISQIGMMNSRNDESLRLFVQGKSKNWIIPFLEQMNYRHVGNADLISILKSCSQLSSNVDLDIDITDEMGENLGIECYFNTTEKAVDFLKMLVENKLATAEKGRFLKNYIDSLESDKSKNFQAFLSHFKIGFKPGQGLIAKAYFGYVAQNLASEIIKTKPVNSN